MKVFNDIYVNCKYQALMNMMLLFNKDKNIILYGFMPKYEFNKDYNVYQIKYYMYRPFFEILTENGILEEKIQFTENVMEEINKCKNNKKKCLIIRIDLYYAPYNLKFYKKQHYKRFILISNVNDRNATIMDKDQFNNYQEFKQIPLSEIGKWYDGYINTYYKTGIRSDETIFIYNLEKDNNIKYNPKDVLSKVIRKCKNTLDDNLDILNQIMKKIINNEEFDINKTLEKLLANKKVEEYRYSIFENNILNSNTKKQQQIINRIRLELLRNSRFNKEIVIKKFDEFIKLEKKINNTIIHLANQNI